MNTYIFNMPVKILMEKGGVKELGEMVSSFGKKAAIVVDPFFSATPAMKKIREDLSYNHITFEEYNDVSSNPHNTVIDKIAEDVKAKKCEVVVGIGGGSAIDSAKAIALLAIHGGNCWDYTERTNEAVKRPEKGILPLIVIPTTSGTGSEATPYSVINNVSLHLKATIVNQLIYPDIAILDVDMLQSMPPMLTALTGIDAFAHCLEAYISIHHSEFTDLVAKEGMRLFAENIRIAVKEPNNELARKNMALASLYGGMAIARKGTIAPHALGQALGGTYNAPHGGALAAVLPECVKWTLPESSDRLAEIAEILDGSVAGMDMADKANALPQIMERLWMEILGRRVSCSTYGMDEAGIKVVTDAVMECYYGDCKNHPKIPTREDIASILEKSL